MSQDIFSSIDPSISGTDLAGVLNLFKDAIVSGMSGAVRPTELDPGGMWVDTSGDPTTWVLRLWTGTDDVEVVAIDLATGTTSVSLAVDSFIVRKISADTNGAILELVKRRVATNGQVLNGDVVGEVRLIGRDDTGGNPIVAKIMYTAAEDQTSSAFGGTLSFYSTPAGTNTLVEHMRFINGMVETLVPHKTNAEVLTGQNVATSATIPQLSATKILVEMTGATATAIQGINSTHDSKVVHIHNRSSAVVTMKHQDAGAIASDRLLLPDSRDIELQAQESIAMYYCVADSRWKVLYASSRFDGFTVDVLSEVVQSWVAPIPVNKVRVMARSKRSSFSKNANTPISMALDQGGSIWAWGQNPNGSLGDGTVTQKTVPTLVLRDLKFVEMGASAAGLISDGFSFGLTPQGEAFMWGKNDSGQLGVGDVTPRSSPVAVLGGFIFKSLHASFISMVGLTTNGLAYSWGFNSKGELGDGTTTPQSSPVAVVGGLTFQKLFTLPSTTGVGTPSLFGLDIDGDLWAWGDNEFGGLGTGDVTARSSPTAVLGGLSFKQIIPGVGCTFGLTDDGTAYAWGKNGDGQLGVGDRVARSSPVAVVGGLKFKAIIPTMGNIAGTSFTLGITTTGALYAWGNNADGALGDGTITHRSSPVAVAGGLVIKKAIAERGTCYALDEDGVVYAWGQETTASELGQGTTSISLSSPVAVAGGLEYTDIFAATGFAVTGFGITWDGKMYSWGNNFNGDRGFGDTAPHVSPTLVSGSVGMKTQDDSDFVLDLPVVGGDTYSLRLGSGPCFFGHKPIGNDIYEVEVAYIE